MSGEHSGGCLCGAVRYRVSGAATATTLCHCRSCRLASGAPALAWAVFCVADFVWMRGRVKEFASSPGATRTFCERCGTSLTYANVRRPEVIDVTSATFDDPAAFAPACEIWCEEEIPWAREVPRFARSSRPSP
ncbi:MAG TPA: GFA family protein [Rudaea sp.]